MNQNGDLIETIYNKNQTRNIVVQTSKRVARYPSKNFYHVWIGVGSSINDTTIFPEKTKGFSSKVEAIKYARREFA